VATLARKKDLRTGKTIWSSRRAPAVSRSSLTKDLRTEVLIVGAGISGALIADALAGTCSVAVVDRRGPMMGSTAATTALVEYEIDTPLIELAEKIGREKAARAWQRSRLAVDSLAARTRALNVRCDLVRRDSLYLAGNSLGVGGLAAECEARRSIGLETRFLDRAELRSQYGINRPAALLAFDDMAVDPLRMTSGYLRSATNRGAKVFAPAEVTHFEKSSRSYLAATRQGPTIECSVLILATGYEFPKFVPMKGHTISSTYVIATRPQRRRLWPTQCFIWEASTPYLYVRTTADGRVICGGEDEDFEDDHKRDALISKKTEALRRKLGRLLVDLDTTPELSWAGAFGQSRTGLPSIGEVPGRKNCWAVMGYGGNGITFSRIAADIIHAALVGRKDPDADLFAF
jgi:glycine/D-amino acid oxidase-like deaminating enzyme